MWLCGMRFLRRLSKHQSQHPMLRARKLLHIARLKNSEQRQKAMKSYYRKRLRQQCWMKSISCVEYHSDIGVEPTQFRQDSFASVHGVYTPEAVCTIFPARACPTVALLSIDGNRRFLNHKGYRPAIRQLLLACWQEAVS